MKILKLLTIVMTIFSQTVWSSPFTAKVRADFAKGEMKVTPSIMYASQNGVMVQQRQCWGLCFSFGSSPSTKEKMQSDEHTYLYLIGDPDNLTLLLVSYACSGPYLMAINYGYHRFGVLSGEIEIQSTFASNRSILAPVLARNFPALAEQFKGYENYRLGRMPNESYPSEKPEDFVNYACTAQYHQTHAGHSLSSLAPMMGEVFQLKHSGKHVYITWDATHWVDKVERQAREVLQQAHDLLQSN